MERAVAIDVAEPSLRLVQAEEGSTCRGCGYRAESIVAVCPMCGEVFGKREYAKPAIVQAAEERKPAMVVKAPRPSLPLPPLTIVDADYKRVLIVMTLICALIAAIALTQH